MPIQIVGNEIASLDAVSASITTEASITATSSATGNTCISTGRFPIANAGDYWVEVFTPYLTKGTTNLDIELFEGASAAGTILQNLTRHIMAGVTPRNRIILISKPKLTAGSHKKTPTGGAGTRDRQIGRLLLRCAV